MTRFVYYTASSVDGYLADDNDSLDWLLTQDIDEAGAMNYQEFIDGIGAIVMGATTYQWIVDHEISKGQKWLYTQPSYVFTHRNLEPVDSTITFVTGSPDELRSELTTAAGDKGVWVVGGGDLAAQFADAGMLDEIVISFAPVMLGSGRPLFTKRYDLELLEFDRNRVFLCAKYAIRRPS